MNAVRLEICRKEAKPIAAAVYRCASVRWYRENIKSALKTDDKEVEEREARSQRSHI